MRRTMDLNYVRASSSKLSSSPYSRSSSSSSGTNKRYLRSANLIREVKDFQYYDRTRTDHLTHVKRTVKGTLVNNGDTPNSVNNEISNNLITYEHLGESWIELVLPLTILGITIIGVLLIGVILFIWIRKYFSDKRDKNTKIHHQQNCAVALKKNCEKLNSKKMNSRKWLNRKQNQRQQIESRVVNDLERKLETIEFKNSPPTSPNAQKSNEDQQPQQQHRDQSGDESEGCTDTEVLDPPDIPEDDVTESEATDCEEPNDKEKAAIIVPCSLPISDFNVTSLIHPQPCGAGETQQVTSSSLSMLQEEVHCIQPREDQSTKIYKSIATSPPPFSPRGFSLSQQQHHKYATTGTQTYFTKAPNSPNNHLMSSSFTVLQTPTSSTFGQANPFSSSPTSLPSSENKENKEPAVTKLRNSCLNKAISNFKQDNGCTTPSSSPSSPPSVISTSPKLSTSPKINNVLQQQNSPIASGDSPPINQRFNFSPKLLTNSPTISSAHYKFGNYFRFPDVGTPPVPPSTGGKDDKSSSSSSSLHKQSSTNTISDESTDIVIKSFQNLSMENDRDNIILKIDEVESPIVEMKSPSAEMCNNNNINNNNTSTSGNTLTIRRARLKSISLDSDSARLVEENLTMPVEELVEIASRSNKQMTDMESSCMDMNEGATSSSCGTINNNNNSRYNPKNIYNLTINLDFRDSSLDVAGNDINMNQQDSEYDEIEDGICRTPTMKYFSKKKAVSLDSDNQDGGKNVHQQQFAGKTASTETFNYYFGQSSSKMNSSISVPSTPKHLTSNKLKISTSEERSGQMSTSICSSSSRYSRKLGSFEENSDGSRHHHGTISTQSSQAYKSNLTASIQQLNVSSSNLKTLPEIMSINDFDGSQSSKPGPPRVAPIGIAPSKSGILQRRGSNHSLTLNLDGSCGNLARGLSCSNYSLGNIHGSHLNITGSNYNLQHQSNHRAMAAKKNLLQRRGSNASLTLNIQETNNNLNRFNSHSSLNIITQKKNLLERRNSNASLTLNVHNRGLSISNCNLRGSECSLSSVNTNQMTDLMMMEQEAEQEAEDQAKEQEKCTRRKFLSSENLHNFSVHSRNGGNSSSQHHRPQSQTPYGSIDNLKNTQPYHEKVPVISTKPLSPQSTSEDFKIYLANIQYLQSASNVLNAEHLKTLNTLFQRSYSNQPRVEQQRQFNNDDVLNNKIGGDGPPISFSTDTSPDEDQKQLLIKLHQEFWNLPTNYQEKPMVFGSQSKNRYKTILPNEHSRVILQREIASDHEPYINANFIKGPDYSADHYIATQGPMQNTIYEFWLMVLQNMRKTNGKGVQKIAMLTDFIESQRQKCAIYFPVMTDDLVIFTSTNSANDEQMVRDNLTNIIDSNDDNAITAVTFESESTTQIAFNFFVVKNAGIRQKNGYSIRKLRLFYGTSVMDTIFSHTVYHYWIPDWPDHKSPQDIDVLLDMSLDLLDGNCVQDFNDDSSVDIDGKLPFPIIPHPIIHCSAGIGRTGCLAAILNGLGQIRANSGSAEGTSVDVLGIVCNLRLQRGGMVQNSEQYELIHRTLCLYQQKLISQT